jgi:transposase
MISVGEYEILQRKYQVEGKPIKQIVRETGLARNTIRKYIRDPKQPAYNRVEPYARPVLGDFTGLVDEIVKKDREMPRRERHTAKRIFERLRDEYGYTGGESTIRNYVAARKRELGLSARAVTFPIDHQPQEAAAQMDWGERTAEVAGIAVKAHLCCIRLNYSGHFFVTAYPAQRQEMLFDGHRRAFEFFGGAPLLMTYDNLGSAVKKILKGRNREENSRFGAFRAQYLFKPDFCNRAAPWEKGGVENMVGYVGREFFVPRPSFASFEELNASLRNWCERNMLRIPQNRERTVGERFAEEAPHLLSLPRHPPECCKTYSVKADHQSIVSHETNRYSVPAAYANRKLVLKAFAFEIVIAAADRVIARHRRSFERHEYVLDPLHYIPLLERKPGALLWAKPFKGWQLPEIFGEFRAALLDRDPLGGGREYVKVLLLLREHTAGDVERALKRAWRLRALSADAVACLLNQNNAPQKMEAATIDMSRFPNLADMRVAAPDNHKYNQLL